MGFGWPRKNPCIWIPHFCGMTYRTNAIDIAFMDGREKKWMGEERSGGHSATYAEAKKDCLRDGILQALLLSVRLDTAFLRYDV